MKKIALLLGLVIMTAGPAYSQFESDLVRLSFPGLNVGARSLGMGLAYTGVANDYSAISWNPAGLGQARMNEVTFGLGYVSNNDQSTFFNNSQSYSNSATDINSVGMVYPIPTQRGSLVFALGYGRLADFTSGVQFKGFNPSSSIIQYWAPDGVGVPFGGWSGNLAYELYLANVDSLGPNDYRWNSKIFDRLTQSGNVIEGGGLNSFSAAIASEVARDLYLGVTLNFLTGSYTYTRNYYEDDLGHIYDTPPFDLNYLSYFEHGETDLSGFSAKFGMLYKFGPDSRLGIAVRTPQWITMHQLFTQSGTASFDNAVNGIQNVSFTAADRVPSDFDVTTPFVFSAGLSHAVGDLLLAGDVDYTDYTQMEFRNADVALLQLNSDIKSTFTQTVNLKAGAELTLPPSGIRLRGGFAYLPSPYNGDPTSFARKYITAGLGFIVENSVAIDLGYAHGTWDTFRQNYDASSVTQESVSTNNLITTVSYRF